MPNFNLSPGFVSEFDTACLEQYRGAVDANAGRLDLREELLDWEHVG